ncbi:alpha/beta hydrolase, partial [Burkholderia pseudomallei]|nr:alpha/beta hydrolase [Burkholderia pseudomallei]
MHERPPITAETTWFAARDGRLLTGTFYAPGAPSASNGRSVLVSGALGVPRGFYERYARFLASDGFTVLTYDYRGIG